MIVLDVCFDLKPFGLIRFRYARDVRYRRRDRVGFDMNLLAGTCAALTEPGEGASWPDAALIMTVLPFTG